MPEPVKPVQNQPNTDPISPGISVHKGAEAAPVSLSTAPEVSGPTVEIDQGAEFAPPAEISKPLEEAGVVSYSDQPQVPVVPGVLPSIPAEVIGPVYGNLPTDQAQIEQDLKQPMSISTPWRALLSTLNTKRQEFISKLFNKQPLQNPS